MRRRRLLWQLYTAYLVITFLALVAITLLTSRYFYALYLEAATRDLEARAQLVREQLRDVSDPHRIDALCKRLGKASSTRITVVDYSGNVLGDSHEDPVSMENHADRPEFARALKGQTSFSMRYSQTRKTRLLYAAIPLEVNGEIVGAVRTSVPPRVMRSGVRSIYLTVTLGLLAVAGLFAVVSLVISRRIGRLLEQLKQGAESFARGDLGRRLPVPELEEVRGLAESMNAMAAQLDERIRSMTNERNEREAILASMQEGVLAVDSTARVVRMNRACGRLLGVDPERAEGMEIQVVIRNTDLQNFVAKALSSSEPTEGDIVVLDSSDRFLQAHGTVLRDAHGEKAGAVIVLNDVTRLRRLERVRRDFVANVSHELKTPITSIRGAVETMGDGAVEDREDARRFLSMIGRQADRLNAIIEDLLMLSRLEEEASRPELELEEGMIEPVVRGAVRACEDKAAEKQITLATTAESELKARLDAPLLESAVVNLIDNAIKYSEPGETVEISAMAGGGEILIRVRDGGCGIAARHLPRIFERFYRIDKARSRSLGGTGLGLAIVKHVVQVHKGYVSVESTPGKGSTFTIHLSSA
jgi:two-component system phosphate regulon sensor histidine kinase PhoR